MQYKVLKINIILTNMNFVKHCCNMIILAVKSDALWNLHLQN